MAGHLVAGGRKVGMAEWHPRGQFMKGPAGSDHMPILEAAEREIGV